MGGLWIEETKEGSTRDSSAARLAGAWDAWRRPAGRFAPGSGPRPRQRGGREDRRAGWGRGGGNPRGARTAAGLDGFDQSKSLNTATDRPINLCARLAVGASTGQVGSATATGVALVEINEVS